jgi:hypothetical protein
VSITVNRTLLTLLGIVWGGMRSCRSVLLMTVGQQLAATTDISRRLACVPPVGACPRSRCFRFASTSPELRCRRGWPMCHFAGDGLGRYLVALKMISIGIAVASKYRKRLSLCPTTANPPFSHTYPTPDLSRVLHRSDYLLFSSGTAVLWEVTGWAALSVWRSRQLDIRRWASSIWTAVIRDPMAPN